ncbi:hypothetical protein N7452_003580 [Penicillium brevicompactum]|uniref:Kinesin-like protein n=1 Tax=Penicillium brevicompactum TaxID=5074 RepID=A0A9W9QTU5_PENBR|nr:hypothetical protein N7452_003580 [Penicillium brevicompactum]
MSPSNYWVVQKFQGLQDCPRIEAPKKTKVTYEASNITVAARVRPMLEHETSSGQVVAVYPRVDDSGVVDLHDLRRVSSTYTPGRVFGPNDPTESIYESTVYPLIPWAWEGNVGTFFAYGQTGSGKTFSIGGIERLVAEALFDGTLPGERTIHAAFFELAGNSAFDLLSSRASFPILEDNLGRTQLVGIREHNVRNKEDLLAFTEEASKLRQTAPTTKNDGSSRSHGICRIRIEDPSSETAGDGVLYLIDLAGSEAARDLASHSSERMKETREINISLSVLKDCIRGIADADSTKSPKKPYIPFRQSMLTKVLKHVFDPLESRKCKTTVLACINPSLLDTGASKNTLRYAEMLCGPKSALSR